MDKRDFVERNSEEIRGFLKEFAEDDFEYGRMFQAEDCVILISSDGEHVMGGTHGGVLTIAKSADQVIRQIERDRRKKA